MPKELRRRIFSAIKQLKHDVTINEIASVLLNDSKKDIACELDAMVKEDWIKKDSRDGDFTFKIKRILDKPIKPTPKTKYAKFEIATAGTKRPVRYMNPFFDLMPLLNQDGRGTCVGFSSSYVAWFNQLRLITPTPLTKEDVAAIKRDQLINVFDQCNMRTDILPKYAPSAEGFYDESRRIGNVTVPEGSYIDAAAQAYKTYGYNYERDRQTAHTPTCAPIYFPLINNDTAQTIDFLAKQAINHRADNYLQITTWDGLKDAIATYGCVLVAIDIYENYTSQGQKGNLPEPRGDVIGGHALCACGYDDDLDVVYVIMSWGDNWTKLSGFSHNYYNMASGTSFVPVVTRDVLEGDNPNPNPTPDNHLLVTLNCNMPCTFKINTDSYKVTKAPYQTKAMLVIGQTYQLSCTVTNTTRIKPPTTINQVITVKDGMNLIPFRFRRNVHK